MVNEEIITGLKNSIDNGENLETAVNILISSGYNPKEVREASNFLSSSGILPMQNPRPDEHLVMPNKPMATALKSFKNPPQNFQQNMQQNSQQNMQQTNQQQATQSYQQYSPQNYQQNMNQQSQMITQTQSQNQQMQQNPQLDIGQMLVPSPPPQSMSLPPINTIQNNRPLAKQLEKIGPPKQSHAKEIVLAVVLLLLMGVLAATIIYRAQILALFA